MRPRTFSYLAIAALVFGMLGCSSPKFKLDTSVPWVMVSDSVVANYRNDGRFAAFFVKAINGSTVPNAMEATISANKGSRGGRATQNVFRGVPSGQVRLLLAGQIFSAMPINALIGGGLEDLEVLAQIELDPNGEYLVNGKLAGDSKEIWVENIKTGARVPFTKLPIPGVPSPFENK